MNTAFKQEFLSEAIRIGEDLLVLAKKSDHGIYWETMTLAGSEIQWKTAESLYAGCSGIALFYLELYKQTKEEKYLTVVKESAQWLEHYCDQEPTDYYAFYTGRLGVSYFLIQLSHTLKDDKYLEAAFKSAQGAEKFLDAEDKVDDLINGISGSILGLLHLYSAAQEPTLIPIIEQYTRRLIERANLGPEGLHWDRSHRHISGLCGFSHGAGGIGYVFLELGRYFNNPTFYQIAEEAFNYENYHYDNESNNWPDLRKSYYDSETYQEHVAQYKKGNREFFETPGNMRAWCHGSPGIGLSRLRAHEILGDEKYKTDIERCLASNRIIEVDPEKFVGPSVLCHGHAGNTMLFVDAYRLYQTNDHFEDAVKAGEKLLSFIKEKGKYISGYSHSAGQEDTSLFMGNAGVGHFFLSICDPENTSSILKPDITSAPYNGDSTWLQSITTSEVKKIIANKYFPKSIQLVKSLQLKNELSYDLGLKEDLFREIEASVQSEPNERLLALHQYEKSIQEIEKRITSDSWVSTKRIVDLEIRAEWLQATKDESLLHLAFQIEELSSLHQSNYDCLSLENQSKDDFFYLLNVQSNGIQTFELSEFSFDILHAFKEGKTINEVIEYISELYSVDTDEEREQVKTNALLQAKEALKSGVLEAVENT